MNASWFTSSPSACAACRPLLRMPCSSSPWCWRCHSGPPAAAAPAATQARSGLGWGSGGHRPGCAGSGSPSPRLGKKGVGKAWTHLSDPPLSLLSSPLHRSPSLYFLEQNPQLHKTSQPAPMVPAQIKAGDASAYLTDDNKLNLFSGVCQGPLTGDTGLQPSRIPNQ